MREMERRAIWHLVFLLLGLPPVLTSGEVLSNTGSTIRVYIATWIKVFWNRFYSEHYTYPNPLTQADSLIRSLQASSLLTKLEASTCLACQTEVADPTYISTVLGHNKMLKSC